MLPELTIAHLRRYICYYCWHLAAGLTRPVNTRGASGKPAGKRRPGFTSCWSMKSHFYKVTQMHSKMMIHSLRITGLQSSGASEPHTLTHTHTGAPVCREGGAAMQRRGHIQHFMVTAWELSHQIHLAQWFWQRLSRSCPARTGITPDCDRAMATVVHQWFPRTPTTVTFTQATGKLWSDWLKQPSHSGNVLSDCCRFSLQAFLCMMYHYCASWRLYHAAHLRPINSGCCHQQDDEQAATREAESTHYLLCTTL